MLNIYQSPTIESVGGVDYDPDCPVFFAVILAVTVAAIAAVVWYAVYFWVDIIEDPHIPS